MSRHLDINEGETYTVENTEEYLYADIDGTLKIDGSLKLIDNPTRPTEREDRTAFSDLFAPEELTMELVALITGIIGLLTYFVIKLRSALLLSGVSLTIMTLMMVILVDLAFVWFWIAVFFSTLTVALGAVGYYL